MKAVEKALQDGLFGQMLQQFAVLFEQMDMLVERFHSGGRNQEKAAVIAPVFALTSSVCRYLHILILTLLYTYQTEARQMFIACTGFVFVESSHFTAFVLNPH